MNKPLKPYPDFPLFPHDSGQWAKKIRGRMRYFGVWADWSAALTKYVNERDALHAGVNPACVGRLSVADLCNAYCAAQDDRVAVGSVGVDVVQQCERVCNVMVTTWGRDRAVDTLGPADWSALKAALAFGMRPRTLILRMSRAASVFRFAFESGMVGKPIVPPRGTFAKPSRSEVRRDIAARGYVMLSAEEIRSALTGADCRMRAVILLGLNCGFGPKDLLALQTKSVDVEHCWVRHPRPKTGIDRRSPLWPETVASVRAWLQVRKLARRPEAEPLLFGKLPTHGRAVWMSRQFTALLGDSARPGISLYGLRHCTATVGGESGDQAAVNAIMGHVDASIPGVYRHGISDDRLCAVADRVRAWLWPISPRRPRRSAGPGRQGR